MSWINERSAAARRTALASALVALLACGALVAGAIDTSAQTPAPPPGSIASVQLTLLGTHNLASLGHDGEVKPRGQNGDVATLGNTAFVGGGALFHGARSTSGRICTDYGGVKVVDVSRPSAPKLVRQIAVEDTVGVSTGPVGNPRRGAKLDNVSASVSTLDAIHHPVLGRDVLAIATQRCEQSFFEGARIEFWDVTDRSNPVRLGVFDPRNLPNPTPPPADGRWGIFEDVRMFFRADMPGKVFAVATTPFSIGNAHDASPFGDFRLLDITDPANPKQIGTFPDGNLGQDSGMECRSFHAGRSAAPTADGKQAFLSWFDGSNVIGDPTSATEAVWLLDLDNLPKVVSRTTEPLRFNVVPPHWGYTPHPNTEGNAADVQPFGRLNVIVSEDDIDPARTSLAISAPAAAAGTHRACSILVGTKLYMLPGQQLTDEIAYVGRGCPASQFRGSTLLEPDPYLTDPAGKIVMFESGGNLFDGCSIGEKAARAFAAGATAVLVNAGTQVITAPISGPAGGYPAGPVLVVQGSAYSSIQLVPSALLQAGTFPSTWQRSTTSNVTVRPMGLAITAATNASPIAVTTAVAHGLATGDRVRITGVEGNTAANGE